MILINETFIHNVLVQSPKMSVYTLPTRTAQSHLFIPCMYIGHAQNLTRIVLIMVVITKTIMMTTNINKTEVPLHQIDR